MKIIRNNFKKVNLVLTKYRGANLRVWSYTPTFNVIELMIHFSDKDDFIFITLSNCNYIKGGLSISKSELSISFEGDIKKVADDKSDFQIIFEGELILKEGLGSDFFGEIPDDFPKLPWEMDNN